MLPPQGNDSRFGLLCRIVHNRPLKGRVRNYPALSFNLLSIVAATVSASMREP